MQQLCQGKGEPGKALRQGAEQMGTSLGILMPPLHGIVSLPEGEEQKGSGLGKGGCEIGEGSRRELK